MNKLISSILFLFIFTVPCFSIGEHWLIGGKSAGMGNASVTLTDLWAINNNQAGLTGLKDFSAGVYYENLYGMEDLSLKAGAVALPTKYGVLGLSMTYFGFSQYNETKTGLAYAKSFGTRFSAGVQLDYLSTHIAENYGNSHAIAAEVGLRYVIIKNLVIAVHIYNPTRAKVSEYDEERAPTVANLGLSYTFSDKVIVAIETEKDIQYSPVFKAGIEYHPVRQMYFRAGISTNPMLDSFGFGIEFKSFNLDFSTTYHQTLGFSPQFSLIFHSGRQAAQSTHK